MLKINQLKYSYKNQKFDFSININKGNILGIVGPSGSGKSTFLALLAGLIEPNSGEIIYNNQNITKKNINERPFKIIFQNNNLFNHLTVQQNIGIGIKTNLKFAKKEIDKIQQQAELFGIKTLVDKYPPQLSGGEIQRTALARIMLQSQPILLLDEPFTGLDPTLRQELYDKLLKLKEINKMTLLLVTHYPEDCLKIADKVALISDGIIKEDKSTKDFFSKPYSKSINEYLGKLKIN